MRFVRGSETVEIHHLGLVVLDDLTRRKYISLDKARAAFDAAITRRLAQGFVEAPDAHADLDARRVLADEQLERGDVLGEIVALQHAIVEAPDDRRADLQRSFDALLDRRHDALYGALGPSTRRPSSDPGRRFALEIRWVHGFAEVARITANHAAVYAAVMELRIATHLRRLELADFPRDQPRADPCVELIRNMLSWGTPPHLREVVFEGTAHHRNQAGDLAPLIAAIPELESIAIGVGDGRITPFAAPALRHLAITRIDPLDVLGSTVPALVDLELSHVPRANAFVDALARSAILPRLRRLAIRHSGLGDAGLATILMHERRFRHLELIDLAHNAITRALVRDARDELPHLAIEPLSLGS